MRPGSWAGLPPLVLVPVLSMCAGPTGRPRPGSRLHTGPGRRGGDWCVPPALTSHGACPARDPKLTAQQTTPGRLGGLGPLGSGWGSSWSQARSVRPWGRGRCAAGRVISHWRTLATQELWAEFTVAWGTLPLPLKLPRPGPPSPRGTCLSYSSASAPPPGASAGSPGSSCRTAYAGPPPAC